MRNQKPFADPVTIIEYLFFPEATQLYLVLSHSVFWLVAGEDVAGVDFG